MITTELIKERGKCCVSGKLLTDSQHINCIQLEFKASWPYPTAGNVAYGISGMAVALIHDDCFIDGKVQGEIKYAVEFKDDEIIYHPVPEIIRCRICGCHELDACMHPEHGNCSWVENDLCSHCKNIPGQAKRYSKIIEELESGLYEDPFETDFV